VTHFGFRKMNCLCLETALLLVLLLVLTMAETMTCRPPRTATAWAACDAFDASPRDKRSGSEPSLTCAVVLAGDDSRHQAVYRRQNTNTRTSTRTQQQQRAQTRNTNTTLKNKTQNPLGK
jgi:hypothetical protein